MIPRDSFVNGTCKTSWFSTTFYLLTFESKNAIMAKSVGHESLRGLFNPRVFRELLKMKSASSSPKQRPQLDVLAR
jgi:hypothetical protein